MTSFIKVFGLMVALAFPATSHADKLTTPDAEVVLTVSGAISRSNIEGTAQFDMEMLTDLDVVTFTTTTIWTDGVQEFQGVPLDVLMAQIGVTEGTILASAINDYTVEIPLTDAVEGGPIVAYLLNGDTMSVRDKGPLWVVYPYDDNADYRSEVVYARSIWQLDRMEIVQ